VRKLPNRKQRRLKHRVYELELQADQAHGEKLDRLCNEIEETRLGLRLAGSSGGHYA